MIISHPQKPFTQRDIIAKLTHQKKKKVRWKKFYGFSLISHKGALWMNRDLNDLFDRLSVLARSPVEARTFKRTKKKER